ncbi:MAG: pirin family protein [Luteibaculaceae bacterium]
MKTIFYPANDRGYANYGWLETRYSFSFSNWYNPNQINFGALRVLNDDLIAGGAGFPTHPHDNMEIISVPIDGALEHKDSMGNVTRINKNEIQVMSAGTGVKHSEYNPLPDKTAAFLQIWIFPAKRNIEPAYHQKAYTDEQIKNTLFPLVHPEGKGLVSINQNAIISRGKFEVDTDIPYTMLGENQGAYLFMLEGEAAVENQQLGNRDALGIYQTKHFNLKAKAGSEILLIEVPMFFNEN